MTIYNESLINFSAYLTATALIIASPGPAFLFVLGLGSNKGRKPALSAVAGIVTGTTCHAILALLGLTVVITASPTLFQIVQIIGACYTLYLGIKILRARISPISGVTNKNEGNLKKSYVDGLLTQLLNPKPAIFFLSFMPQFVAPGHTGDPTAWIALAGTPILFGLIWYSTVALFSTSIGGYFSTGGVSYLIMRKIPGLILVGISLYIFLTSFVQMKL